MVSNLIDRRGICEVSDPGVYRISLGAVEEYLPIPPVEVRVVRGQYVEVVLEATPR